MKNVRLGWVLVSALLILTLASANALAAKVMVVTGLAEARVKQVGTYQYVYDGINEVLASKNISPEYHFVDLDASPDEARKKSIGEAMVAKIKAAKPDVVITLNDPCLKYVGSQLNDVPVVFAYIFSKDLKSFGLPKTNVTGVTRRSFAPDIWGLANKLTGAHTVALLSKRSQSMEGVRKYILAGADKLEKLSGVRVQEMYLCDTFAEWKGYVENWKQDLIYLADTSRIERDGQVVSREEIVRWTVDNSKVPVIAATDKDTESGALFSIVTSEHQIGRQAAEIAMKIMGGTPASAIPIQASAKGKLLVNGATVMKMKIDFPYEILATAEKVYE